MTWQDWEREDGLNRTVNISQVISSSNESQAVVSAAKIRREYSRLERLEGNLRRVRATIREARNGNQTQDSDYVPTGPMYWNPNSFHR